MYLHPQDENILIERVTEEALWITITIKGSSLVEVGKCYTCTSTYTKTSKEVVRKNASLWSAFFNRKLYRIRLSVKDFRGISSLCSGIPRFLD
jgi:hypothetical protein